ncbi:MAG TPA: glycerophosphodiester phosphodiesterase family protein [Sphingomonas sp.]|uniref:glycerophosphodiester phosphodiesterase family protein n=1 Tax=Sphingomonas sp. TaxID=28214 RepID=UPI002ED820C1
MRAPDPARTAFLKAQPFAHRGLHGDGRVENSRAAFVAAITAGYGIECDVQVSRDGEAFVFHDADLDRLTAHSGPLATRDAQALDTILLSGTNETIPTLYQLLSRTLGRVPVLIEVKTPTRDYVPLCRAVARELDGYRGPVAIMSFHPGVVRWFRRNAPAIVRGLVVTEQDRHGAWADRLRTLALWRAQPDFLAYDIRSLPSPFAARARARGLPVLTWTVRDAAAERIAFAHADEVIFEGAHR